MQPELVDAAGASVPYLDGRWLVEENQRYELRVAEKCEARIEERPLAWEPAVRGFVLKLPMAAGASMGSARWLMSSASRFRWCVSA